MDNQRKIYTDPKRTRKENRPNTYRTIRCLPMFWKILKALIWENIYSLQSHELFPKEHKGCHQRTRGIDIYYTLINTFSNRVKRDKNKAAVWVDSKKAYDWGPQSLIIVSKVKLATLVEGDPKAPFSIATTPRRGHYSIPFDYSTLLLILTL